MYDVSVAGILQVLFGFVTNAQTKVSMYDVSVAGILQVVFGFVINAQTKVSV